MAKKQMIESQQKVFVAKIQQAADDEKCLEAWSKYIVWARQAFLNGGDQSQFARLLNDCIERFSAKEERNSYAFLRICAEFSDYCAKPLDLLAWMEDADIGRSYSLFWETKSRVMEDVARDLEKAERALTDGILNKAQPIERLHVKREELRERMRLAELHGDVHEEESTRRAFGVIGGGGGKALQQTTSRRQKKAPFVLDDGGVSLPSSKSKVGSWKMFGMEEETSKENKDMAKQWTKNRVEQDVPVFHKKARFSVFDDSQGEDAVDKGRVSIPARKQRKEEVHEADHELLMSLTVMVESYEEKRAKWYFQNMKKKEEERADKERKERAERERKERMEMAMLRAERERKEREEKEKREKEERERLEMEKVKRMEREMLEEERVEVMDTMNYENFVGKGDMDAFGDDLPNIYDNTIDVEAMLRQETRNFAREPTLNTQAMMSEVEQMFNATLSVFGEDKFGEEEEEAEVGEFESIHGKKDKFEVFDENESKPKKFEVFDENENKPKFEVFDENENKPKFEVFDENENKPKFEVFDENENKPKFEVFDENENKPKFEVFDENENKPKFEVFDENENKPKFEVFDENENKPKVEGKKMEKVDDRMMILKDCAPEIEENYLSLGEAMYDLQLVSEGAGVSTYRAEDLETMDEDCPTFVLKICQPPRAWEYAVHRLLQKRCSNEEMKRFGNVQEIHVFSDKSLQFSIFNEHGNLRDIMEIYSSRGGMPEELVVYFALDLLKTLQVLHSNRILHGDISLENILLHVDSDDAMKQNLLLIDFSKAVDLEKDTDTTLEKDVVGVCKVLFYMLFMKDAELVFDNKLKYWRIQAPETEEFQKWAPLFEALLSLGGVTGERSDAAADSIRLQHEMLEERFQGMEEKARSELGAQNIKIYEKFQ